MENFEEISGIILALLLSIGLIKQAKHGDKDLKTLRNDAALQFCVEEELLQDADGDQTEVAVAKRY